MMTQMNRGARIGIAVALVAAVASSCSRADLLEVQTPDQITPEAAGSASGAAALRVSALGNFANMYSGDNAGGGVGMNIGAGLLTDEMTTHRGGTEHMDTRAVNENTFPSTIWALVGSAQTQLIRARKSLSEFAPAGNTKQSQMGQMQALEGFTYVLTGEMYCNGVPIGNADDINPATDILSNAELFQRGIASFDSSLQLFPANDAMRNMAIIGKARALVNLKQYSAAAALVTAVPTTYRYEVQHSRTTIINDVFDWMVATRNFGVVNREGINGLDYLSSGDPRIQFDPTPRPGQDGSLTISPTIYPTGDTPVPLATGIMARMIEAEAVLEANNITLFLDRLNTARQTVAGLTPLTDPGTTAARVDLLFRERAFWFWLTGTRLGDMRRLIRQYGRGAESVFPTGPYFKGGVYGTDVNLIPNSAERNNPAYTGCANRDA
jgi:hypothetical protein